MLQQRGSLLLMFKIMSCEMACSDVISEEDSDVINIPWNDVIVRQWRMSLWIMCGWRVKIPKRRMFTYGCNPTFRKDLHKEHCLYPRTEKNYVISKRDDVTVTHTLDNDDLDDSYWPWETLNSLKKETGSRTDGNGVQKISSSKRWEWRVNDRVYQGV